MKTFIEFNLKKPHYDYEVASKVNAIKFYRRLTLLGLKEAKDYIESGIGRTFTVEVVPSTLRYSYDKSFKEAFGHLSGKEYDNALIEYLENAIEESRCESFCRMVVEENTFDTRFLELIKEAVANRKLNLAERLISAYNDHM